VNDDKQQHQQPQQHFIPIVPVPVVASSSPSPSTPNAVMTPLIHPPVISSPLYPFLSISSIIHMSNNNNNHHLPMLQIIIVSIIIIVLEL
jgi:hypothetical protein